LFTTTLQQILRSSVLVRRRGTIFVDARSFCSCPLLAPRKRFFTPTRCTIRLRILGFFRFVLGLPCNAVFRRFAFVFFGYTERLCDTLRSFVRFVVVVRVLGLGVAVEFKSLS
jgi:hypothetical protein